MGNQTVFRSAIFRVIAAVAMMSLLFSTSATAGPENVLHRQQISGDNPFPDKRCKADEDVHPPSPGPQPTEEQREERRGMETEPSVAVNPTDPSNIIATWQIGLSPLTSVYGVAVSHDNGSTWRLVEVPGLSRCTQGEVTITQDPAVSFAPDGTAYLASQATGPPYNGAHLLVNRSLDGGNSWSAPFAATPTRDLWDKQRSPVVGDPLVSDKAYLLSTRWRDGGTTADLFFFKTTDGGQTWSLPKPIFLAPRPNLRVFDPLVEALREGILLVTFTVIHTGNYVHAMMPQERHDLLAIRSLDGGETWSDPVMVAQTAPLGPLLGAADPDTGRNVVNVPHSQFTAAANGTAYVVWHDIESARSSKVMLASSHDGGASWSQPLTVIAHEGHALLPSVAAMPDGTVGVTWYDTRRDKLGDKMLTTEYWFAHSHDGGTRWEGTRVAGPFDLNTAAERRTLEAFAFGLGEYTGLSARPDGFASTFMMTKPQAQNGPYDVFFARLRLR